MPFIVPISVKAAVTAGAVVGGAIALLNNKEKVFELGERVMQKGADFCREKLEAHKKMYAVDVDDGAYGAYYTSDENSDEETGYGSEATTPSTSDTEWEHDLLDLQSLD